MRLLFMFCAVCDCIASAVNFGLGEVLYGTLFAVATVWFALCSLMPYDNDATPKE